MRNKLLIILSLMMFFVSCGEKNTTNKSSENKISKDDLLRVAWWGGETRHQATLKAIELFEKKYPDIKVKAEYFGFNGYHDKLVVQITGNSAPDVFQLGWNYIYSIGGDAFYDLKESKDFDINNYSENIIKSVEIDNRVVAVPYSSTGRVFYWNKTTFDKAGLKLPETFADLENAARVFKQKLGKDYYPLVFDKFAAFQFIIYYLEQKTGKPFIKDNKVAYTNKEMEDGFNFYLSLINKGITPSFAMLQSSGTDFTLSTNPDWLNGKLAGTYAWDSLTSSLQGLSDNAVLASGPMITGFGKYKSGFNKISMVFAVNKLSNKTDQAAKFLQFICTDPEAVKILGLTRGIPGNKKAVETLSKEGMLNGLTFEAHKKVNNFAGQKIDPKFEDPNLRRNVYEALVEEVDAKVTTPKKAADILIEKVNFFLSKENKK